MSAALQLRIYSVPQVTHDLEVLTLVTEAAGGSTVSLSQGTWEHNGKVYSEPGGILEAIVFGNSKELKEKIRGLIRAINQRATVLGQRAILVSITPTDAELVEASDGE